MNYLNKIVRLPITLTHLFLKKIFRVMGYNLTIKYKKIKPKKIEDIILLKNNVSSDIKRILIKKYV